MNCAHPRCGKPIELTHAHVRQARLDAAGVSRRGEFDAFHMGCHFEVGGKVDYVERAEPEEIDPDQEALPLA